MVLLVSAVLIIAVTVAFTLSVRTADMPEADPVSPVRHLEERRAAIYENLRDLQFEFRVGKLSDADYQRTKLGLQKELAGVLAEMERITQGAGTAGGQKGGMPGGGSGGDQPAAEASRAAAPGAAQPTASRDDVVEGEAEAAPAQPQAVADAGTLCPHCGAEFPTPMKFCGECGKAMA